MKVLITRQLNPLEQLELTFSVVVRIHTAPVQMSPVTTSNSATNVVVTWTATSDDGGYTITEYRILFKA